MTRSLAMLSLALSLCAAARADYVTRRGNVPGLDGEIKAISSTRTNRVVEVGNVKLEVEPATAVLMDCKPVTVADLKSGLKIKALYEVKDNNRYVAKVIEAQQ